MFDFETHSNQYLKCSNYSMNIAAILEDVSFLYFSLISGIAVVLSVSTLEEGRRGNTC